MSKTLSLDSRYTRLVRAFCAPKAVLLRTSSWNLFRDWLCLSWAFLNAHNEPLQFKKLGDKFSQEGEELCGEYLCTYLEMVEDFPFEDILGALYMEIGDNIRHAGQYFTPMPICKMMAAMTMGDEDGIRGVISKQGYINILDPAVGSGAMLLAAAGHINEIDPGLLVKCRFYGIDLDETCVTMTRIQLRMNGLDEFGRMIRLQNMYGAAAPFMALLQPACPTTITRADALKVEWKSEQETETEEEKGEEEKGEEGEELRELPKTKPNQTKPKSQSQQLMLF